MRKRRKRIEVIGTYRLPHALGVTPGCLGKTFTFEIAGLVGKVNLPLVTWNDDRPILTSPSLDSEVTRHLEHYLQSDETPHLWGDVTSWNTRTKKISSTYVSTFVITFDAYDDQVTYSEYLFGRGHPKVDFVNDIFGGIEEWFDLLRTWLEVKFDQDMDSRDELQDILVPGSGLQLLTKDGAIISLPASASSIVVNMRSYQSVTLPTLRKAAVIANQQQRPSDAHILLRDARAAMRRGYYRRAAIDAGSAAELTLADHNRVVTRVNTPKNATLGWYVKQPKIALSAGLPADFYAKVVELRNRSIHNNLAPARDDVLLSIEESEKLVRRLDPLPL